MKIEIRDEPEGKYHVHATGENIKKPLDEPTVCDRYSELINYISLVVRSHCPVEEPLHVDARELEKEQDRIAIANVVSSLRTSIPYIAKSIKSDLQGILTEVQI